MLPNSFIIPIELYIKQQIDSYVIPWYAFQFLQGCIVARKKSDHLQIWLTPGLKKALKVAAEKDSRSMASLIEKLIKDHLDKEKIEWKDEA